MRCQDVIISTSNSDVFSTPSKCMNHSLMVCSINVIEQFTHTVLLCSALPVPEAMNHARNVLAFSGSTGTELVVRPTRKAVPVQEKCLSPGSKCTYSRRLLPELREHKDDLNVVFELATSLAMHLSIIPFIILPGFH